VTSTLCEKKNMNKKYQVFLSSTYTDLKDERRKVMHALMEMDCIPAGMEMFPAADDEQMQFIKNVIDDCDFYLLIVGGRYGSVSDIGISYTEMEYVYAKSKGMPIITLIHSNPEDIPVKNSEFSDTGRQRLEKFKAEIQTGRLVKFWNGAEDLAGKVVLSLNHAIRNGSAVGWVRGNFSIDPNLYKEIEALRRENEKLKNDESNKKYFNLSIGDLAPKETQYEIRARKKSGNQGANNSMPFSISKSYENWMALIGPFMFSSNNEGEIRSYLAQQLVDPRETAWIDDQSFQDLKIQFLAFNWIFLEFSEIDPVKSVSKWILTDSGKKVIFDLRARKV
jgi:hypothetical protein